MNGKYFVQQYGKTIFILLNKIFSQALCALTTGSSGIASIPHLLQAQVVNVHVQNPLPHLFIKEPKPILEWVPLDLPMQRSSRAITGEHQHCPVACLGISGERIPQMQPHRCPCN
eukprot:Blabericola_migrator_1__12818@NODE_827_length_6365_cov_67_528739_g584_i0_p3_GENE_NODE_827_length_6365_cov_67_528739_g584_i0NODE_827_length_6365_cov_67_528739_g584_i0_p3_ORF_typecomplete_len115_score5_33_NODE_827_length_6365_cov_67_528739_g584_i028523196